MGKMTKNVVVMFMNGHISWLSHGWMKISFLIIFGYVENIVS